MKNYILSLVASIMAVTLHGQVGINNTTPKTTLDVTGVTTVNVPDGVLVPRFTATELTAKDAAYGAAQNGTLVFITSGTGSSAKTIDITGPGFYYYDNPTSKWKIAGGSSETFGNITPEITTSYTVNPNDAMVKLNITTPGQVLTLPTAVNGMTPGKQVYVSNIGTENITISPQVRNSTNFPVVRAGRSGILVFLGGDGNGSWDWITGS